MKSILVIAAFLLVIVAVQAGKGGKRCKCDADSLKKLCGDEGQKKIDGMEDGDCKKAKMDMRTDICNIFNADQTKIDDACAKKKEGYQNIKEKCPRGKGKNKGGGGGENEE